MNNVDDKSPPELILLNTVDVSVLYEDLELFMLVFCVEVLPFEGLHNENLAYELNEEESQHR